MTSVKIKIRARPRTVRARITHGPCKTKRQDSCNGSHESIKKLEAQSCAENLRDGGFKELSEDEKDIAEQADRKVYRLYQDRAKELRNSTTTSLNALGQCDVENKGEDLAINKGDDIS